MTTPKALQTIRGDWGTSRLRVYLCDADDGTATVRAVAEGPGAKSTNDFPGALREAIGRLPRHPADTPVILAGMVGSNIGWRETAYAACPAEWRRLAEHAVALSLGRRRVVILPGVSCISRFGYTDVMRGEETQLLGMLKMSSRDNGRNGRRLACLPGTHTKWVTLDAGGIQAFATTVQGELHDLLRQHSMLVPREARAFDASAFSSAVELIRDNPGLGLMQALFSTRSRSITGELHASDAASYLSGLLVGVDIRDTGRAILKEEHIETPVLLVGEPRLTDIYSGALRSFGIASRRYPGDECIVQGLGASLHLLRQESPVKCPK